MCLKIVGLCFDRKPMRKHCPFQKKILDDLLYGLKVIGAFAMLFSKPLKPYNIVFHKQSFVELLLVSDHQIYFLTAFSSTINSKQLIRILCWTV